MAPQFAYIGSKKTLIPFIEDCISNHIVIDETTMFADLFAGTGIVGNHFKSKFNCRVIANDMEKYSYILNEALLNSNYTPKLQEIIDKINNHEYPDTSTKLITKTYCNYELCERNFFTVENGMFIDYVRNVIEQLELSIQEYNFLLASLVVSLDKIANTTGVYGAYLKHIKKAASKTMILTHFHQYKVILFILTLRIISANMEIITLF
jgi:adenine-specific DNA-methyltransferase